MKKMYDIVDWFKKNWIVIAIVFFLMSTNAFAFWQTNNAEKLLELAEQTRRAQVQILEEENERLRQKTKEIDEEYEKTIKIIEIKYRQVQYAIEQLNLEKVQEYEEDFIKRPRRLAARIKEVWGFEEITYNDE